HRQKMAGLTRLVVLPLNVKASEIADLVEPFLSEHAIVSVDDEGNVLIIRDVEHCVKDAEMIVEKLDVLREKSGQQAK
ncbi:MAG: secretin N-terminal domain-containing protein, partial [Candidatus Poribacteria bacterium]